MSRKQTEKAPQWQTEGISSRKGRTTQKVKIPEGGAKSHGKPLTGAEINSSSRNVLNPWSQRKMTTWTQLDFRTAKDSGVNVPLVLSLF